MRRVSRRLLAKCRPLSLVAAVLAAGLVSVVPSAAAADEPIACGPEPRYRCGQILVIIEASADETIEEVVVRNGGAAEDVLFEFRAVRDLLAPPAEVNDLSEAVVYGIAVPVGSEEGAAARYSADVSVYAASVDRETFGTTSPNTSVSGHGRPPAAAIGASLIALALFLGAVSFVGERGRP